MDHGYFIAMSYGAAAIAVAVELAVLVWRRRQAFQRIDAERGLEATD